MAFAWLLFYVSTAIFLCMSSTCALDLLFTLWYFIPNLVLVVVDAVLLVKLSEELDASGDVARSVGVSARILAPA